MLQPVHPFLFALALALPIGVAAEDKDPPRLDIKGFGTLGLARSDDSDAGFVRDLSQPRGLTTHWSGKIDSVLGVQANYRFGEPTEAVRQSAAIATYQGLKIGITIASSIPAAVISMGILRAFNTGTIRENNIVQTVASSGGTLSAIILVLPGLVMIGWWQNFPFIETFLVCALGGVLGVLFSIPLRRALVVNSPLPYPEGVAASEVLKIGARDDEAPTNLVERKRGPFVVLYGAIVAAFMQIVTFTGIATTGFATYFRLGAGVSGLSTSYSLALIGAGHLVGISVGVAMLVGIVIAWGISIPYLSTGLVGDIATLANTIRGEKVRFIGAGTIGIAAIWSLLALVRPVFQGLVATARAAGNGYAFLGLYNFQKAYDVDKDDFSELPKSSNFTINPRLFFYPDSSFTIMLGNSFYQGIKYRRGYANDQGQLNARSFLF